MNELKCKLTNKKCGKDCPLLDKCPYEIMDIALQEMIDNIVCYFKERKVK